MTIDTSQQTRARTRFAIQPGGLVRAIGAAASHARRRVSPGGVLGILALTIALAAPAQAAIQQLAPGSVGTSQLRDGAVTTAKLHGNAVTSWKILDGTIRVGDLAAAARPRLPRAYQATHNEWNDLTGSSLDYVRLSLPAGRWAVTGKGTMDAPANDGTAFQWCRLMKGATELDFTDSFNQFTGGNVRHGFSLQSVVSLSAPATLSIGCQGAGSVGFTRLMAVEVR